MKIINSNQDVPEERTVFLGRLSPQILNDRCLTLFHKDCSLSLIFSADELLSFAKRGWLWTGNNDRLRCSGCGKQICQIEHRFLQICKESRFHFDGCEQIEAPDTRFLQKRVETGVEEWLAKCGWWKRPDTSLQCIGCDGVDGQHLQGCLLKSAHVARWNEMTSTYERLQTFKCWPKSESHFPQPEELATAGFFKREPTENNDKVVCAWCGGGLYNFEEGDDAINEHKKLYPWCSHVIKMVGVQPQGRHFELKTRQSVNMKVVARKLDAFQNNLLFNRVWNEMRQFTIKDFVEVAIEMSRGDPTLFNLESFQLHRFETQLRCRLLKVEHSTNVEERPIPPSVVAATLSQERNPNRFGQKAKDLHFNMDVLNNLPAEIETLAQAVECLNLNEPKTEEREKQCCVCTENESTVLLVPCGHICLCRLCAVQINKCPKCRQEVYKMIRAFF